jgi:hypothetical protein
MLRASHFSASYLFTTTIKFYLNAPFAAIRPLIASAPLLRVALFAKENVKKDPASVKKFQKRNP